MNVAIFTVGSNPLPIYVVAEYLLMDQRQDKSTFPKPDYIIFVYTDETKPIYQKLTKKIRKKINHRVTIDDVNLGDKERDQYTVVESVKSKLSLLNSSHGISSLHLHYTGGTKPMSVYSYFAVKELAEEQNIKPIFSDLHPDEATLVVGQVCSDDLRNDVRLDVKEILQLHGMDIENAGTESFVFPELDMLSFAKKMVPLLKKKDLVWEKIDSMKRALERYRENHGRKLNLSKDKIREQQQNFKIINSAIDKLMPVNWNQVSNNPALFTTFIEFIHGKWLEDYLLYHLQQLRDQLKITDLKKSVEAKYEARPCEIDIIAMKGYQLYLFSCTTSSDIKIVKGKAFEAIYRADQLGGSHARVIVVSMLPGKNRSSSLVNLEELEKDLSSFDAKFNKKCKLIGCEDLLEQNKLQDKLYEVFKD